VCRPDLIGKSNWRLVYGTSEQAATRQNTGVLRSAQNDEQFAFGQSLLAADNFSYFYNICEAVLAG
jgi:hypothetical protein